MSINKQKIKNVKQLFIQLLSYSTSSFKGREEVKTDRYGKTIENELINTIRTRRSNLDETLKERSFLLLKLETNNQDKFQLSSVAQSLDINSYRMNNNDIYTLDNLKKISVKNNKENQYTLNYLV